MNKRFMILVVMFIAVTTSQMFANNLSLAKTSLKQRMPKHHPAEQLLMNGNAPIQKHGRDANQKLLVLLVEFANEVPDDPLTTGNGKFILQADSSYHITIGAPPHDRRYYEVNLEALRLYYAAASFGGFNLSYDIWPQSQPAYTLPHTMGYYNPPNANSDLFLSRMEDYFKESFEIADSLNPDIDFSQYDHFMIIHAGADWQHDIFGDTPSDIPSFYIHVAAGKEAIVDNGLVSIAHACNVPEMITQDLQISESDSLTYVSGYGALNGVYAHEFGHSMGLVDLYNVRTFQPEVGVFDIMDSGGGTQVVLVGEDNTLYAVEGILPSLPGAWSRIKMFETDFRQRHILEEITDIGYGNHVQLKAAESKYEASNPKPYFVKVQLSNTEYILLENRSVDPDGDGGTAFIGIDPEDPTNHDSPNKRVVLAPTPVADNLYTPSYEYDYLLPSWQSATPNAYFDHPAIGGGVLIWHIDDEVIYNMGTSDNGTFTSNLDNNSVNSFHSRRGIQVVEADGLPDIGNPYSYYWTGTSYEYYFKYRPIINSDGFFTNWSNIIWNNELSSESNPPLSTNLHTPGLYSVEINSIPANFMDISINPNAWSNLQTIGNFQELNEIAPVVAGEVYSTDLPVISENKISYLTHSYDAPQDLDQWQNLYGDFDFVSGTITQPIIATDMDQNGIGEYSLVTNNKVNIIEGFTQSQIEIPDSLICDAPLFFNSTYFIPGNENLYASHTIADTTSKIGESFQIPNARLISNGTSVFALTKNQLFVLNSDIASNWSITNSYVLPGVYTHYQPVGFRDLESNVTTLFLMNDIGDVYCLQMGHLRLIFRLSDYHKLSCSQLALGKFTGNDVCLLFASDDIVFALNIEGAMIPGFPARFDHSEFSVFSFPKIVSIQDVNYIFIKDDRGGYFTVDESGRYSEKYSYFWNSASTHDYLYYESQSDRLYLLYSDDSKNVNATYMNSVTSNPISWNGYRNGSNGFYLGMSSQHADSSAFHAYIYPNPVSHGNARLRVVNKPSNAKFKIFDIEGKLKKELDIVGNTLAISEIPLNFAGWSSGVYICVVDCGKNKSIRFKIAIQK